jgi:hypothetical protein
MPSIGGGTGSGWVCRAGSAGLAIWGTINGMRSPDLPGMRGASGRLDAARRPDPDDGDDDDLGARLGRLPASHPSAPVDEDRGGGGEGELGAAADAGGDEDEDLAEPDAQPEAQADDADELSPDASRRDHGRSRAGAARAPERHAGVGSQPGAAGTGEPYRPWFAAGEPGDPWFTADPGT